MFHFSGPPSNNQAPASNYSLPTGGPSSNTPAMLPSGPASSMASGGPPSNAPISQGPPSNAPASQGPPSNAPMSHGGPPSNAPTGNNSPSAALNIGPSNGGNTTTTTTTTSSVLPADIADLVNDTSLGNESVSN